MPRFSPRNRWVVVPTVVATATLVTAVAWAGASPGRSAGSGHFQRSAATAPAPRVPLDRGTADHRHRRPVPRPTRPTVAPTPTRPAPTTAAPTTTAPTTVPAPKPAPTTAAPTTTPPATTPPPPPAPPTTAPAGGVTDQVVALTNAERARAGCGPLAVNRILTSVAQAHSQDMAGHDYFSHDSQDGRSPFDRMTAAGYRYSTAAENIAAGQPTAQAVVTGWMNSPGHRANILNCGLREIGVGHATAGSSTYGSYWTQDFGTPR